MKRLLKHLSLIIFAIIVVVVASIAIAITPQLKNMSSEYGTSSAIHMICEYLQQNDGQWPDSPEKLDNRYPVGGDVTVDYSANSVELIESTDLLKEAVRPRSGKFYTYPHYHRDIAQLLQVLRETNGQKSSEPSQPMGPQSILE